MLQPERPAADFERAGGRRLARNGDRQARPRRHCQAPHHHALERTPSRRAWRSASCCGWHEDLHLLVVHDQCEPVLRPQHAERLLDCIPGQGELALAGH
jgi:hypothetical protein